MLVMLIIANDRHHVEPGHLFGFSKTGILMVPVLASLVPRPWPDTVYPRLQDKIWAEAWEQG